MSAHISNPATTFQDGSSCFYVLCWPERNVDGRAEQLGGGGGEGRVPVQEAADQH